MELKLQHEYPSKEEFEKLPKEEQKALVDRTSKLIEDMRPLNRAERRSREKNRAKLRRARKILNGN